MPISNKFNRESFITAIQEIPFDNNDRLSNINNLHKAVSIVLMNMINKDWNKSKSVHFNKRRALYLSMEFLQGRAIFNNLLCLGLIDEIEKVLNEETNGFCLSDLEEIEDHALGNGGLGRLASCFLDSAATLDIPLDGYGIRYRYGYFKQGLENGFQTETADDWIKGEDWWSERIEADSVEVEYNGFTVLAVPYDMPIIGYGTDNIGTLRLWQAECTSADGFDFAAFDRGEYVEASSARILAENISRCLYPNDNSREGKILRLKQEYFFSSASVQDCVRTYKKMGRNIEEIYKWAAIQLNDTHPVIAIPELVRILIDNERLEFFAALEIARKTFNYTNHTIMAEALEKWDIGIVKELLPRIYEICLQINEAFISEMYSANMPKNKINSMKLIADEQLHMARMAVCCSGAVNGVAAIHTEILKDKTLKDWYELYPEKFQNKTNGITPRRWLRLCNPELSTHITSLLGSEEWVTDLNLLKELRKYENDKAEIERFMQIKKVKKEQLSAYIMDNEGVRINADSIFDIQIKRLHEYKRQLMNAFSILYIYYEIKAGTLNSTNFYPTTFIIGAKSAPGYARAKGIIKYINEIANLVNNDSDSKDLIKVVFVKNYRVSYAEKLVSGADVSEQISMAGTEASGTGNMKFMLNGTVTLGTFDGANVEIVEEAGEENNYIFGARVEELDKIMPSYDPRAIMASDKKIARVIRSLIDGTTDDMGTGMFRDLYYSLLDGASWHTPDNYYILGDLKSYIEAKLKLNTDYKQDREEFYRKCWVNMCQAGKFSSDRTIKDYAENIWKI